MRGQRKVGWTVLDIELSEGFHSLLVNSQHPDRVLFRFSGGFRRRSQGLRRTILNRRPIHLDILLSSVALAPDANPKRDSGGLKSEAKQL